ncbi:membrane-associated transporter protein-like [Littorina saxatilis]|uniref:Uncharacterized protein n=1 Tax=Littorina saxatilis TaxID=31220 RepID=A0AAN9C143_9CAEN
MTATFSLRRRVQLCLVMLALESYISFEEIFMVSVLQRLGVPLAFVSLPGTISSFIGVFVIPFLGWASDRFTSNNCCGQKRPYALLTLTVCIVGTTILFGVNLTSLYSKPIDANQTPNDTALPQINTVEPFLRDYRSSASADEGYPTSTRRDNFNTSIQATSPQSAETKSDSIPSTVNSYSTSVFEITESSFFPASTASAVSPDPASNSMDNSSSDSAVYIPVVGILGIAGFVLMDHGYDASMSTVKVYMIAVTSSSQHDDVFVMGTLIGAVGGCMTSLLGFVNLSSLFPAGTDTVLDTGIAQCFAQTALLWLLLVVLGSCSLLTGSERAIMANQVEPTSSESSTDENKDTLSSSIYESIMVGAADQENELPKPDQNLDAASTAIYQGQEYQHDEKSRLILQSKKNSCRNWKSLKKKVLLCTMTFLGLSTNYAYFVYVTNYVGEVIYGGDSRGDVGSDSYRKYVEGEHMASLGMLTFYCLFVAFNFLQNKILKKIGMRAEYLAASVFCCVVTLALALTDSLIVFFVNAAAMAVFRSAVYTIPFILSNNYHSQQQDSKENGEDGSSSSSSGSSMAAITAMIPASYVLVSLIMGPLMEVTGYPGAPIFFAAVSCALGIVSTFFVQFS